MRGRRCDPNPLNVKDNPIIASKLENLGWIEEIKKKLEDPNLKDLKDIKTFTLLNG